MTKKFKATFDLVNVWIKNIKSGVQCILFNAMFSFIVQNIVDCR